MLIAMLLPAIQAVREAARRMTCSNNLKQWGLAIHNHHDIYQCMPPQASLMAMSDEKGNTNNNRAASWVYWLLPFMEQQALWDMIQSGGTNASVNGSVNFPAGRPGVPWDVNYKPWTIIFSALLCPSDSAEPVNAALYPYAPGASSYRACNGDLTIDWKNTASAAHFQRGAFRRGTGDGERSGRDFAAIIDGLSNTLAVSESGIGQNGSRMIQTCTASDSGGGTPNSVLTLIDPNNPKFYKAATTVDFNKGRRWSDGEEWHYTAFHTIMAPNSVTSTLWGFSNQYLNATICSPSSYHTGGVNTATVDGAVRFIADTIDTGDKTKTCWSDTINQSAPTQFGIWGALGSIEDGEAVTIP